MNYALFKYVQLVAFGNSLQLNVVWTQKCEDPREIRQDVQKAIHSGSLNEVWLILRHITTCIFPELLGSNGMFRMAIVVPTSENAVYKSAINLLIKNIKPQLYCCFKKEEDPVHATIAEKAVTEASFWVRINTSWKPRIFTFETSEILRF